MITRQPLENDKLWLKILERAREAVGENVKMDNLDDLFDHLKDIVNHERNTYPEVLSMFLPVDEALFEIDANTRKIKVPDMFANGIAVQGDEMAEILYFSIDRYFDAVDLYDREIYIQWKTSKGDQALYPAFNKSLNVKEGKVVFGWPITSEITEASGPVQFSIRFYQNGTDKEGNDILEYSFGTLTATVKVNPSLNFDIIDLLDAVIVDKTEMLFDRIEDSIIPVAMPIFEIPSELTEVKIGGEPMRAQAKFGVTNREKGDIVYKWVYTSNADGAIPEEKEDGGYDYVLAVNPNRNTGKVYYVTEDNENYTIFSGEITESVELFERFATYAPTAIGSYQARAINKTQSGESDALSKRFEVKAPVAPVIKSMPERLAMAEGSSLSIVAESVDGGELSYQWKFGDNVIAEVTGSSISYETFVTNGEGNYSVTVSNEKNGEFANVTATCHLFYPASDFTVELHIDGKPATSGYLNNTISAVVTPSIPVKGNYSYEWYKIPSDKIPVKIEGATNSEFTPTETGNYQIKVVNTNYSDNRIKESSIISIVE